MVRPTPATAASASTSGGGVADNIRVAVRLRSYPHNMLMLRAGKDAGRSPMVKIDNDTDVRITTERGAERSFSYDYAFDSSDRSLPNYATQEIVYDNIGHTIVENCMRGFNGCLFAYGQTGIRVWVSYLEIYNEHLHDLLADSSEAGKDLSVMEHPSLGVYVKGATEVVVRSEEDIERMLEYGLKRRAEGATNMNAHSSRSHAVFRIKLECKHRAGPTVSSRVNLIDLAGSERQGKTGSNRNTTESLSALGMVIKQLSEAQTKRMDSGSSGAASASSATTWIPFRSSKLTFLLKDSLVGNSKTFMIACISPASTEAEETLSTLRFASSVKKIKTVAKVNVDHKDEQIKSLQNEISALRSQLQFQSMSRSNSQVDMLSLELDERQQLVAELKKSYDTQLAASEEILRLREEALDDMGLSSNEINTAFGVAHDTPYMLNISEDPMLSGCLLYYLKTDEETTIGSADTNNIVLHGLAIPPQLCIISNIGDAELRLSVPERVLEAGGRLIINGKAVGDGDPPHTLKHLDRVVFGRAHMMRIMIPKLAKKSAAAVADGPSTRRRATLMMRPTVLEEEDHEQYAADMAEDDSSEAYQELRHYIEELRLKLSSEKLDGFLKVLKTACPLIDEANDLSTELRPSRHYKFEAELIWDVFNSEPEDLIVIRLMEYTESSADAEAALRPKVLYYWGLSKFMQRLELMRDLYHQVTMGYLKKDSVLSGEYFDTPEGKVHDPWSEPSIADIQAQQEFSNRLSQNRDLNRLQAAMTSVVLSSMIGDAKLILQAPSPSGGAPTPRRRSSASESPVKKIASTTSLGRERRGTAVSFDSKDSVTQKDDINGLLRTHFNDVKKMLANALGEMKSRRECEASSDEVKRKNETLEMENRDLQKVTELATPVNRGMGLLAALNRAGGRPEASRLLPSDPPPLTPTSRPVAFARTPFSLASAPSPLKTPLARFSVAHRYPLGVQPNLLRSQREVAVVSFGRFIDSQLGGPHTAFSKFDIYCRKRVSLSEFDSGLATLASAYRIAAGRDPSLPPTTFGCETAVLFGYLDCLEKGSLTIDDFLYASACGTAHGRGLPLPESPIKVSRMGLSSGSLFLIHDSPGLLAVFHSLGLFSVR
ncbi:hypothetical protein FOZ60_009662 [Perkinsus olseni]|uniref:Kinesin motor domain-containing protein n=1 Tax=Perkinsus olseni TaxID=32597 RepID=A0A7J6PCR6_PEROL|nr:hypothetical protein FOZ60_009662 [Perkinsus olseni]